MEIVIVVQARMGSTRLPGKILKKIDNKTLLEIQIERIKAIKTKATIVVATTKNPNDNEIVELCKEIGVNSYRGDEYDLLNRHYQAAKLFNADTVVKIPSDCPLIDPNIIDKVLDFYIKNYKSYDYVSNLHPPSYPDGNDVEVMSFDALQVANKFSTKTYEREHTTPLFWNSKQNFRVGNVVWETGMDLSESLRLTVDYQEDFDFIKAIYNELYPSNNFFGVEEIIDLLHRKPELAMINAKYNGLFWYNKLVKEEELSTI